MGNFGEFLSNYISVEGLLVILLTRKVMWTWTVLLSVRKTQVQVISL